jgi:hypothetical protein
VYLVTDSSGALYALKKIRCPFGQESVRNALKEVEAYNLFNHKSIIKCIVIIPEIPIFVVLDADEGGPCHDPGT